ncbi:hypothetical protein PUNSTDRAFT_54253 [Punctularia strigosozonata HHB-11173 SS5]|uniref:uncharacterized protein n=1 Tax=Punctularia strigosozonata (strain HHB-11173) TaxID=741275 RepID=UPI0004417EA7|nr:uncharacterized protein PUNSTDRAFT_54253 [Punctularia strigosozonata HHB-11173 SS5]EIN06917.1 hypothetical protein PUNSTDRAFT_54253 [Punctularia strigosozonata HHB-11173 SS5]
MTAKASPWLQGCTIPKGRVTPLAPNHPLAHNLVAYIHCRALDPASIPEQYQPGQQPAPVEEVTPQIQPGAADNYTRGSTESLSTHDQLPPHLTMSEDTAQSIVGRCRRCLARPPMRFLPEAALLQPWVQRKTPDRAA